MKSGGLQNREKEDEILGCDIRASKNMQLLRVKYTIFYVVFFHNMGVEIHFEANYALKYVNLIWVSFSRYIFEPTFNFLSHSFLQILCPNW